MEVSQLGGRSLYKVGATLGSFKQSGNIPVSKKLFMQLANTENVNLHYFKIFISISPPTDLLLLKSLITCLMSFTETC